ncbi:MAG: PadR family transcriptional regulator [Actinomycetota bacterium]
MAVSKVEVVILGLLAEETLYGYELLERFRSRSMGFWVEVAKASVYQALQRLERQGLVMGKAQEGTEGPDRRVYKITRPGRDRLRRGLPECFAGAGPYEMDSSLALGFSHLLPAEAVRRGLDLREESLASFRAAIAAERARAAADHSPGRAVANRLLDQQEALAKAEAAWLAAFRRDLGKIRR